VGSWPTGVQFPVARCILQEAQPIESMSRGPLRCSGGIRASESSCHCSYLQPSPCIRYASCSR